MADVIPDTYRLPLQSIVHPDLVADLSEHETVHITGAVIVLTLIGEDGEPFLTSVMDEDLASWTAMGMLDMELTSHRGRCIETDDDD